MNTAGPYGPSGGERVKPPGGGAYLILETPVGGLIERGAF